MFYRKTKVNKLLNEHNDRKEGQEVSISYKDLGWALKQLKWYQDRYGTKTQITKNAKFNAMMDCDY